MVINGPEANKRAARMSKIQMLKEFVNKRLIDVAEEICGIFERTFAEYEEEANRSRRSTINTPPIHPLKKEEILMVEWRPSLEDQEETEPPQTQDVLSERHEWPQTLENEVEEARSVKLTMPPFTCVKSEYDYAQPSLLHLSQNARRSTINTPPIHPLKEKEILLQWRPSLEDQEETEPPQTQEELSEGHEWLQTWENEVEEARSVKLTMPPSTCVKSEYDYAQPSLLHLSQNKEYNGHSLPCRVSEPSSQTLFSDCSVAESNENGNNDNFRENGGPLSSFITHTCSSTKEKLYICNGCGKAFYQSTYIRDSCMECVEVFNQNMGIVREPLALGKGAYHVGETSMQRGKTRTRNVDNGIKNKHKRLRNLGQSYINSKNVLVPGKRVRDKNCAYCRYKCNANFPESERENIFKHFWGIGDSVRQKNFILAHVLKRNKKRHTTENDSRRQNSIEYFFTSEGRKIRVCKDFFLRTLDVSGTFARSAISMCPSLK